MSNPYPKTVLVVDDDSFVLSSLEKTLSSVGCSTLTASTGEEALSIAENSAENIDMLLTDMMMPGLNGKELAEEFLSKYPQTRILVMSAFMCPSIGTADVFESEKIFIQKPFTPDSLLNKMKDVMKD
ncbi:MAG: response regulator [Proteobacteria bacterium]|nr:response regulator [Pseudomonadota bacterium]MBU1710008.1 response regulator [Pseudomonadota bacterium]